MDLNGDKFMCAGCEEHLRVNLRTVINFLNKYAVDMGPELPQKYVNVLGPAISLQNPSVTLDVTDHVIASCYEHIFIRCHDLEEIFQAKLLALSKRFTTFEQFFIETWSDGRGEKVRLPNIPDAVAIDCEKRTYSLSLLFLYSFIYIYIYIYIYCVFA